MSLFPGGQSLSLGGRQFGSDSKAPVTGTGKVDFNRATPTVSLGWGNLVRREGKHFSVPFELGVAFEGTPKNKLESGGKRVHFAQCQLPQVGSLRSHSAEASSTGAKPTR